MAELGQETVDFSTLVGRAAEESYVSLKELVDNSKSSERSDTEKKINLLKFLVKTQQRMLRLNVLAKWCQQVPLIQYSQQLTSTLSNHDMCFTQTADSMFFMHEGLQQARAPIYDVPSAIEILLTGTYQRLPKCVEDVGVQTSLNEEEQKPVLKKLDMLVRSKLLEVTLPKEISQVDISDGTVLLRVDGEFKVLVTLGYRGHMSLWRILHLELLVGDRSGPVKLEETRKHILGDDLERRMAAAENPFLSLYSVLHELCVALVMNTVIRQVQGLRQGRWKDAIKFELISDAGMGQVATIGSTQIQDVETDSASLRTPGLKILYWLDFDSISGTADSSSCPYIKIEPGPDMLIKCIHSTFVIDPITGKEAEFSLDQSCIDVEKLLLRAICYNRYTRLLEVYKELVKCSASGDVILQIHIDESAAEYKKCDGKFIARGAEGQEVLRVRAYGSSFFSLGINTRKGRFLLHSSRDILTASTLLECEDALNQGSMTATQVFSSLRSKSILHLFACTGRFIGLEVYENNFAAAKLPKNILNGSNVLLMGFPDCGSSYFLLMQLDKDLKLIFKLLEARSDPSGKVQSLAELNNVNRVKNIDVANIPMLEDELNLSLLDLGKLDLLSPSDMDTNQNPEHVLLSKLSFNDSILGLGSQTSSFSSIVDELFELEKGSSANTSGQSAHLSFNKSSHFGNFQNRIAGTSSPKWEGGPQVSQINNVSSGSPHYGGSIYSLSNSKGMIQYDSVGSPSNLGRNSNSKKLSASNSDQDLASLMSPPSTDSHSVIDEDRLSSGNLSSRILSPPKPTGPRLSATMTRSSVTEALSGPAKLPWPNSWTGTSSYSGAGPYCGSGFVPRHDKWSGKRTISDMMDRIPSLQCLEASTGSCKRRKTSESTHTQGTSVQALGLSDLATLTAGYNYASLVAEANKGHAPSTVYVSALLHVVRHCSLCIKHARLTSQMEALDIPFVEDIGLRNASSNIWFRLPFARGYTWKTVCLRLGQPGSMYWDVKINDQHFKDLWELQKGSVSTPWGSGVRIANASDADSHIRYDSEGVVLSYHSVEANSIKKLVADIQRLYSARTFALGMRKLLGARSDEKMEDCGSNSDGKSLGNARGPLETVDKHSEQMRRAFSIEAVGLMSLWFSFGSGVLARFVVEWESGKDGCTMHVSPDQLWPHTKFLEDFINGAEVASLLDCIRLTAGPLHALAAATRPARAGPSPGVTGSATSVPPSAKQSVFVQPQGPTQSNVTTNATQGLSGTGGNPVASTPSGPTGNHGLHSATMLTAAGRGGPGIVPSSLLPIDVSVVLRGPYWIRIIYREYFAVDMRCFAGDQVWLQPATPPKEGPSVGGSLPCPQFRPFIMEHVAQELNGLEPNFTGGQQNLGMSNMNSPSTGTTPQLSNSTGNRLNLPNTGGIPRVGAQVINRVGNSLSASSNTLLANSGLPLRRAPAAGVPAHVRGELNTAIIGLGDDGGYGGGWVPIVALKKVLRGILKYLGVLWLFAQLPDLLREILGSILKDNEGALLNLDHEQPALRFFVGGYVFAVSVHRVQLLLQVLSVKRFHQSQQQNPATSQEELTQSEISEICEFFSRRVASEPYDASRVASFVTLLTLPISVLREFLKLISWKKGLSQAQGGDAAPSQKPRIELCLENHAGFNPDGSSENSSATKSNIHYDRPRSSVDFGLTVVLDPAHIPHINAAGGAAWLPYCVSVRLRYSFGDNPSMSFIGMEGSHGGRACWQRLDDWEKSKQRVARTIEVNGSSGDVTQGRLKIIADSVQRTLHICLQGLRDGNGGVVTASAAGSVSH